MTDVAVTTYLG